MLSSSAINDCNNNNIIRKADEYIMTSKNADGVKRSNVCGDGYRIEGALLKSYPYSKSQTYLPYEDCYMTFQARQLNNQIRIRIVTLDINDIHGGINCLDSLRFYKSAYIRRLDKLDSVECGQVTDVEKFNFVSSTGIVTAHFTTDGGNVHGLGFEVILTSFRHPNKTHPCDTNDEEFLCNNGDCISSLLLYDGVAHCLDGSDEIFNRSCMNPITESVDNMNIKPDNQQLITKFPQWRGIIIIIFFLIIFLVFLFFMIYFLCRRCFHSPNSPNANEKRRYSTIIKSPLNDPRHSVTTTRIISTKNKNSKHHDNDYNLL